MVDSFFVGLFCLFFAHCIADFSLQSDFIAEYKSKDLWVLVVHCIIYTGFIMLAVLIMDPIINSSTLLFCVGVPIFLSHFIIDSWKVKSRLSLNLNDETDRNIEAFREDKRLFHIDQILHLVILVVLDFLVVLFS